MAWTDKIFFFPGEDPEALKTAFVELYAKYDGRFDHFQIAREVFKDCKDPELRVDQAAQEWANDVGVAERIRVLRLKGPAIPDASENDLVRRALMFADNERAEIKDRIAAVRLAGELQGMVKKSVDSKVSVDTHGNAGDFLAALAAKLPV